MDVVVRWNEGLQFKGTGSSGHEVVADAACDLGGLDQAARPVELLLVSLCACTGMDVVSILNKMRVPFSRFEVGAVGKRREEYPKSFTDIEMVYRIWGPGVDEDKLRKAVDLSMDRYCTVSNTLKPAVNLTFRYEIDPEDDLTTGG